MGIIRRNIKKRLNKNTKKIISENDNQSVKKSVKKNVKKEEGSVTVESIFVIPMVFLTVCLMIYIACLLFERCALVTAADRAATEASISWKDNDNVDLDKRSLNIYWRVFDGKATTKINLAAQNSQEIFKGSGIQGFTNVEGYAAYSNGFVNKSIYSELRNTTIFPKIIVMRQFGLSSKLVSAVGARSVVPDYSEFIRNTDLVVDLERELENNVPFLKSFVGGISEILERIRGFIGGLL
ncbi:MAG: pilus assembly protein [Synergistaceae bacterium]|nr:pilus assembly protein [Synergistaceae bacterium]